MEQVVGRLLVERGLTIAIGESCTGGLIASRLTDVPGSSAYLHLGVVAYSNQAKIDLLGVSPDLIERHGAVSEPVAQAMASGARERGQADIGVGVTGIAGPSGGSDSKPVGTVALAVIGPEGLDWVRTFSFPGGRDQVKFFASQAALDAVRRLVTR
jgi:nicotinamide-nucleotide amidase